MKNLLSNLFVFAVPFFVCMCCVTPSYSQRPEVAGDEVVVERDLEEGLLRVRIPAQDGKVAWEDVLRALMRAGHLEDNALKDKFPSGKLDLEQAYSRYALLAVNLALAPDIRMEIVPQTHQESAHLLVTVNEESIQQKKRGVTKKIRNRIMGGEVRPGTFGLRLPDGWDQTDPRQLLVIVVHGFNSSPERFEPFAEALRQSGILSATYSYPDDQPIADSAEQLSADLKKMAADHPQRPVALVTHSMGGLVSRAVIEQPELDPGNVTRLIMIAPPNHGSLLAHFALGLDILDHAVAESEKSEVTRFYAAVEDGLSEARHDLKPDSPFIHRLNARSRNPKVHYSIFLGTGGHLTEQQVNQLREGLRTAKDNSDIAGIFTPRFDKMLADLDEVIGGKGDGVVAVKRGRLEGVEDTVLADFTHLGVLQTPTTFADDEVYQGVVARLK